jgi:hypothetical protein
MTAVPFTRPTVIAAVAFLTKMHQAPFNHMVLRLGLEHEITSDTAISVAKKADLLGRIVVQRPADPVDTLEGTLALAETVIREAVQLMHPEPVNDLETDLARGLARDGYVVAFDERERPALRAALPEELGLRSWTMKCMNSSSTSAYRTTPRKGFSRNAWRGLASCTVRKAR